MSSKILIKEDKITILAKDWADGKQAWIINGMRKEHSPAEKENDAKEALGWQEVVLTIQALKDQK